MDFRRDERKRTARAPAKLNLVLDVLGRRADGFHNVETLMVPVRLADSLSFTAPGPRDRPLSSDITLKITTAPQLRVEQHEPVLPHGSENLVVRALRLLQTRSGCELGAHVELVKRIPIAAGLGGGSSDAAAALRLANRGWGINWSDDRLSSLAAEIGSDVPFFVSGGAAICRGKGECVERLAPLRPLNVVIIKPPVGFSTAEVYRRYDDAPAAPIGKRTSVADLYAAMATGRMTDLGRCLRNSLQPAASLLSTWVEKLRHAFDQLDFVGHQLSGSGSAYFGLCRHAQQARRLANVLRTKNLGIVFATQSCQ